MTSLIESRESLLSYPLVSRHGLRRIRVVLDSGTATDRLVDLPLPGYVIRLIAELLHEGQRKGHQQYREGYDEPVKPLDWSLAK